MGLLHFLVGSLWQLITVMCQSNDDVKSSSGTVKYHLRVVQHQVIKPEQTNPIDWVRLQKVDVFLFFTHAHNTIINTNWRCACRCDCLLYVSVKLFIILENGNPCNFHWQNIVFILLTPKASKQWIIYLVCFCQRNGGLQYTEGTDFQCKNRIMFKELLVQNNPKAYLKYYTQLP